MAVVYAVLGCAMTSAAMSVAALLAFIHAWRRTDDAVIVFGLGLVLVLFASLAVIYGVIGAILRNNVKE